MIVPADFVLFSEAHGCGSFAHVRRHIVDVVAV